MEPADMDVGTYQDAGIAASDRGYDDGCRWGVREATPSELRRLASALQNFRVDTTTSSPGLIFMQAVMELFGGKARAPSFADRESHACSLHYWTGFAAGAMACLDEGARGMAAPPAA